MEIEEYFEFKKYLHLNRDIQESKYHIDISEVKEPEVKVDKAIRGLIGFLINAGIGGEAVFTTFINVAKEIFEHPDNIDFANQSAIEDKVNDNKERNDFIDAVRSSEDQDFLKDVYRSWIFTHQKNEDKEDED